MNANEHLTRNQIIGYRARAFAENELREIGRHLLRCASCRRELPAPTAAGFEAALMTERGGTDQFAQSETPATTFPSFPAFWGDMLKRTPMVALSGGALVILFGFSFLIWLGSAYPANSERDVAKVFQAQEVTDPDAVKYRSELQPILPRAENENILLPEPPEEDFGSARISSGSKTRKENSAVPLRKITGQHPETDNSAGNRKKISAARGTAAEICSEEAAVSMETGADAETVQLRWKKIPKAVKYHLYVSDDEEILVDEYETARENVYLLKKPLDPVKTYKWKIIITLENGQTIVGDAQKFTVKDLRSESESLKSNKKSHARCAERK